MKGVLNSFILVHPSDGREVEENINVKRIPLSHSKYLVRGKYFVVGPIDKELLGKEAVIEKLEIMTFDQARIIKELEAKLEVFQREVEEEKRTGIFDVKEERFYFESNEDRTMELEAQMFEVERVRAIHG